MYRSFATGDEWLAVDMSNVCYGKNWGFRIEGCVDANLVRRN